MSDDVRRGIVIAEVGGSVDETTVGLGVHGANLDPEEVSRILGCKPTRAHRAGDPRARGFPPWPKGAWLLTETAAAPSEPEVLIASLLDRLTDDPAVWRTLHERFELRLSLAVFVVGWTQGFELSPRLVRRIGLLGLGLGVTVYAEETAERA